MTASKATMDACDAVIGPCSCGAWHSTQDAETRVAELRARAEKAESILRRWVTWLDRAPDRECIAALEQAARDLVQRRLQSTGA